MNITTVSSGFLPPSLPPSEGPGQRAGADVCTDVTMEAIGHLLSFVTQDSENLFTFLQAHGFLLLLVTGPVNSVECSVREISISPFAWGLCTKEKLCLLQVVHSQYVYLCPNKVSSLLYFTFSNRTIGSPSSAAFSGLDVHLFIT